MPNSLLWVCLVAIWLFVLVPMVVKSRPTVRKTSDAALATRVLHRGGRTIAKTKRRMASGRHPHDAEWEPPVREYRKVAATTATAVKDRDIDTAEADDDADVDVTAAPEAEKTPVMKKVAIEVDSSDDIIDAEIEVDEADTDAEAVADDESADDEMVVDAEIADAEIADAEVVAENDDDLESADDDAPVAEHDDDLESELDEDSDEAEHDDHEDSDLEEAELEDAEYDEEDAELDDDSEAAEYDDDADDETADDEVAADTSARRARRGGFDPEADRERSSKRYRFRQRVMALLGVLALAGLLAGIMLGTLGWVAAVVAVAALVGYMAFLRRAVRNEHRIFQQRMRRLARARREEEERRAHPEVDPRADIPQRLRRPGAVVLEIDDEDPIFDHLPRYEHVQRIDHMDHAPSYRRVVGQ